MSNRALALDEGAYNGEAFIPAGPAERVWLPPEAPLAMPRQEIGDGRPAPLREGGKNLVLRRFALFAGTLLLAGLAAFTPFMLYARDGFMLLEMLGLGLFSILVTAIACWFCSAVAGFFVLLTRREGEELGFSATPPRPRSRTALLMPLYNEDAAAAIGRLTQIEASLAQLGASHMFDIFVLSDSTKAAVAAAEWTAFNALRVRARSRVFYRRREENVERKAGNIADWARRFGASYPYMVILDADSMMSGETLLHLVEGMERRPGAGLIQTTPTIINSRTLYARANQFGVRLYGRVAAAGLAWWAGSEASYWGHNAIVRTRAFAECCGLPILPGRKPFGGHIMSHDVVEAALLRRGGWTVHVAPSLGGSHEETPPNMLEFMRRERRWCQGNLQHMSLMSSPSLHWVSRFHMLVGVMAYVSSPLWLASLVVGMAIQVQNPIDWGALYYILHPELTPLWWASMATLVLLMGPKLLGGLLVMLRPDERAAFGGGRTVLKGMALEIVMSAVLAPVMMIGHTRLIWQALTGKDAGWAVQVRAGGRLEREEARKHYRWEFGAGLAFCGVLLMRPDLFLLFSPIVLPLLFAAPLAALTSRADLGVLARRKGFLVTPEERASRQEAQPTQSDVVRLLDFALSHGAEPVKVAEPA